MEKLCQLTWYHISKANGGHGDEAKVKGIKEIPILIIGEEIAANAEENG